MPLASLTALLVRDVGVHLFSILLIPRPAAPWFCRLPRLVDSRIETGLDDRGVPLGVLVAVVGDSVPIRDFRLPERGVILELRKLETGVEISSLCGCWDTEGDSELTRRRGDFDRGLGEVPASFGVSGLFVDRKLVLSVGVKGFAGVPWFCLSRGIAAAREGVENGS